jgi:hypothetical protein
MKLWDLERSEKGIRINVGASDGSDYILFYHLDGMYSYCKTANGAVVHLGAGTEIVESKTVKGSFDIV